MMRKHFSPVVRHHHSHQHHHHPQEDTSYHRPKWSPPPAPHKFQNTGGSSSSGEENDLVSSSPSPLNDQKMEACFGVRRMSTPSTNTTGTSVPSSLPATKSTSVPTRLSFGSIFTQLRRLPQQQRVPSTASTSNPSTPSSPPETARRDSLLHDLPISPSTLTNHQASKNLHLLKSFTDSGPSRVQAMTIASILYNRKVTEGDIRGDLTPKEKFAYKKFCLEIEDKLEMITSRSPAKCREPFSERTLRKIGHLYALYTKALSDQIWDTGTAKADITSRAIAHLVKCAIAGGPEDHPEKGSGSLEDNPESMNPVLASSLSDPIQAFLIVYGRYCSTGKVQHNERLRKLTHFNEIVSEFFHKLVQPPERLYIYDEGIARFATVKYEVPTEENFEVVYMHLTNYSLNKFSESYVREGDGSKRTLTAIYQWMAQNGYDVERLKQKIGDIVVKTLLCSAPTLKHNYKTSFPKRDRGCSCFELLGFDILLDRHLNPVLLEVNHSPSFNLDLPVDHQVKKALLRDMLNMVYLGEELRCPQGPPQMMPALGKRKKDETNSGGNKDETVVCEAL